MNNYQLEKDESIILERQVKVESIKSDIKFTLTSKNIILEKEKGIFKKKLKVIDIISLSSIKVYKDKVQIKQRKSDLIIQTTNKNVIISFSNGIEAKKIEEEIISIITGSNIIERSSSKLKKAINIVSDVKDVVVTASGIVVAIVAIFGGRKK